MKKIIEKGSVNTYIEAEFNKWLSGFLEKYKEVLMRGPRLFELVIKDENYRPGDFKEIHVVKLYLSCTKIQSLVVSRGISINSSKETRHLRTWTSLLWYLNLYSEFCSTKKTVLIELRDAGVSNRFYFNMANIRRSQYL